MSKKPEQENMSKNEVETKKAAPLAQMPDYMKGKAGAGLEEMGQGDYQVPRIKLLQSLSPEVADGIGKPGEFYHTVLEQSLGTSLAIVPLYTTKMFILWNPRDNGGGILARADDGIHWSPSRGEYSVKIDKRGTLAKWTLADTVAKSGLDQWGTYDPTDPRSQPAATRIINVALVMPEFPEIGPAVLSFQRSSIGPGQKFLGKLKMSPAPIYGRLFNLTAFDDTNQRNESFKNVRLEANGFVPEADFRQNEELYEMFAKQGLKVRDLEGMQGDDEASSSGAGAPTGQQADDGKGKF